jgi:hypothetical protein
MSHYNNIAGLVSKIRNARYGEMVNYLETLIDSGDWRNFTTPVGHASGSGSASSTTSC